MNYKEAFQVADAAVFANKKRHLKDVEVVVLQGSWQDQTYEKIAEASRYSAKFLKQDAGPQLWKVLSEALGEAVSKTNFKAALERRSQNPDFVGPLEDLVPVEPLPPEPPARQNLIELLTPVVEPELPVSVGQVPLVSAFYVERLPIESICYQKILQPGALIRIKALSRMGKTSLMSKVLNHVANHGYRTVALNLRLAEITDFTNLDTFLRWLCNSVTVMQELPNMVDEHWNNNSSNSKLKCTSYFQKYLLAVDSPPLALALDEVDRIFPYPAIAGDSLSMLRTWYESARTNDKWRRLRLVLVHEEEYNQMSIDRSPFNVGEEIKLLEFTPKQVCDWVQMNGLDWDTAQVEQLNELVGGRPYLVHETVFCLKTRNDIALEQLLATAPTTEGIYGNHLQKIWLRVQNQPNLVTTLRQVVTATSPVLLESLELEQVSKLLSMGLVKLQGNQVKPSCELYRQYFCAQVLSVQLGNS